MGSGYSTTTYRMKLYAKRMDWLKETKILYNKVQGFYHNLLLAYQELLSLSNQKALRELEKWTIGSRTGNIPLYPLPFGPIPLYFRRAAINGALSAARSYMGKLKAWQERKDKLEQKGKLYKTKAPNQCRNFIVPQYFTKGNIKILQQEKSF